MSIQQWLGEMPKTEFVAQYYGKLPYSRAGAGRAFCNLATWETIGHILTQGDVDVMVVKQGRQKPGAAPHNERGARALSEEGYTVLIRHAERHDEPLARLAGDFARDFGGAVNIHLYATPAGQYGFGWHYDAEEVFILQTTGKKEYGLRKNTVHPWPLAETIPADMQYPREIMPLMKCLLTAGDWLYIPSGYWHRAVAEETAISLAIGVMAPTAMDLYDQLRTKLLDSLLWRQRLPVTGEASPHGRQQQLDQYRQIAELLAADLQKNLCDEAWLESIANPSLPRSQTTG